MPAPPPPLPNLRSGRWVLPFRACWNAAGDGVIVGNMSRFVDIYDASSGALAGQVRAPGVAGCASVLHPLLCRCCFGVPPHHCCLMRGSISPSPCCLSSPACPAPPTDLQLSSPFMTAIPSRNAVHPHLPVLAAATNSGRIHIYR